ncbi:MAG: hypothetical protein P4L03_05485 [Terracidiphilus sp.]|nr:hypothetical protein [Terracidiphilus sp.]
MGGDSVGLTQTESGQAAKAISQQLEALTDYATISEITPVIQGWAQSFYAPQRDIVFGSGSPFRKSNL